MQGKKKSIALKEIQGESSAEDSDIDEDDEDLALVIRKANKMMSRKFYKKGFRKQNFKKDESSSINCYECNKLGQIEKDCLMLKEKYKKFKKVESTLC